MTTRPTEGRSNSKRVKRRMQQPQTHAYTQALIDAWRRFSVQAPTGDGPETDDYPGLVENLFVVAHPASNQFTFRNLGPGVERLFGRELVDHDFLSLWDPVDRPLIAAAARCAVSENGPTIINARASRLEGSSVEIEFTLAPIRNAQGEISRLLGLCQVLTPSPQPNPRPIGPMRLEAVFPPAPARQPQKPRLRLVVCND